MLNQLSQHFWSFEQDIKKFAENHNQKIKHNGGRRVSKIGYSIKNHVFLVDAKIIMAAHVQNIYIKHLWVRETYTSQFYLTFVHRLHLYIGILNVEKKKKKHYVQMSDNVALDVDGGIIMRPLKNINAFKLFYAFWASSLCSLCIKWPRISGASSCQNWPAIPRLENKYLNFRPAIKYKVPMIKWVNIS